MFPLSWTQVAEVFVPQHSTLLAAVLSRSCSSPSPDGGAVAVSEAAMLGRSTWAPWAAGRGMAPVNHAENAAS